VLFPSVPQATSTGEDLPGAKTMRPTAGFETRPLGPARTGTIVTNALYDAILDDKPYPIRGLIGWGSTLLIGRGNVRRGREALTALEFFVHADLFMTPTAGSTRRFKLRLEQPDSTHREHPHRHAPGSHASGIAGANRPPIRSGAIRFASPVASSVSTNTPHSVATPSAGASRSPGILRQNRIVAGSFSMPITLS